MHLIRRKGWEIPEREATPEALFLNRRAVLGAGVGSILAGVAPAMAAEEPDPSAGLYPAKHNDAFTLDRELTPEKINSQYNNFYEFGTQKKVFTAVDSLKIRPWTIKVDGMVEKAREIGIDDLLKTMPLEERLYRHRCVEAWSMTIPWTGFPLKALIDAARPLSSAKYVRFETFLDPKMAPGQKQSWYPWPYVEGLTMAEATNDLTMLVTGAYGKPLARQFGAPIRLHVPWKYGFKSIKSITRISFVDEQPKNFWQSLQSSEYGFWANVNPEVPHPRWSQATEEVIGTSTRRPTLLYNGYAEQVAGIYKGMEGQKIYF
ncbi:MAG: sulfite oxidase subunit YedY [Hyphomicrobiales bacterium]|nr:sulfite oxidase subunit YedY [Hyphomicrobiales bacterium]